MDLREQAIQRVKNNEISITNILCAFDIIGREYLNGELAYTNTFDDFFNLITDFELECNEIVGFIVRNPQYDTEDLYMSFDGEVLTSFEDTEYFERMIIKKMNGECAEFIMGC